MLFNIPHLSFSKFIARFLFVAFVYTLFLSSKAQAQTNLFNRWQVDSLIIVKQVPYTYQFPEQHQYNIQSLKISLNGASLFPERDYRHKPEKAALSFFSILKPGDSLNVRYTRKPFNLKKNYFLFKRDTLKQAIDDSTLTSQVKIKAVGFKNPFADFGKGLQKSGSIMRGVNIGTNSDLTLNSGLNLELSGKLSDNVEIVAALTDESTPIQPEGNTQSLDEVDRVFIQFKSPYVEGTVGDLILKQNGTKFGNVSRKLKGINVLGKYEKFNLAGTVATTRGFFHHNSLIGQEGNQGPYQLLGKNNEREIVVLAGTEQIWINGQKMVRGESNDYIIEYSNGQITFTNKRLVTSESRIEVNFEYYPAIQKYNRTALGGLTSGKLFNNTLQYKFSIYQESDNVDQAVSGEDKLTEEEKRILRDAGDDFSKAFKSGETFLGTGKGFYDKIDTVVNAKTYPIFIFKGSGKGSYNVVFTFVGSNSGNYVRDKFGEYSWVAPSADGQPLGSYEPVKLIPLPQTHQVSDLVMSWKPSENINISSEYALSRFDQNTFSTKDNGDNVGNALSIKADVKKLQPTMLGLALGTLELQFNSQIIDRNFMSIDRFNDPDFQRYWNVLKESAPSNEERSLQFGAKYSPVSPLKIGFSIGSLRKEKFKSNRYKSDVAFNDAEWFISQAHYELVESIYNSGQVNNVWHRVNGNLLRNLWHFTPEFLYSYEKRYNQNAGKQSGFRFHDIGLRLGLFNWDNLSGFAQTNERNYDVYNTPKDGKLIPQSRTNTHKLRVELQNIKNTAASLELVSRRKNYTRYFESISSDSIKNLFVDATVQDTVWQDVETNLAELKLSHFKWKKALNIHVQYRISTEQTALREKVYIKVEQGRGRYRFDSDLNEYVLDPDGDYVLFILPTGDLEPVTKLESALRFNVDPGRYIRKEKTFADMLLRNISSSSYFRVEEETKDKELKNIYLLNLSSFQKNNTLRGTLMYDQDLFIMKRNRTLNFRLQYRYRDDLSNQFLDSGDNEDRLVIEKGVRADWRMTASTKVQSELRSKQTKRINSKDINRNRDIHALFLGQKYFYNPASRWQYRLEAEYGQEENRAVSYPLKLWFALAKLQASYILAGKGRFTASMEYQTVNPTENPNNLTVPYEMARGKKEGISKKWLLRAEYNVAKNILFTFSYSGRDDAAFKEVIHTGQAEIRAFF